MVLLTPPTVLPGTVAGEISRLTPSRVVVMGGHGTASQEVEHALEALLGG